MVEPESHALCMPKNEGYRQTLGIRNAYCFSTTTIILQMPLNVTLSLLFQPRLQ